MERLIVDTGFFVGLGRRQDEYHRPACAFFELFEGQYVTVAPVVVEACHFLGPQARANLLDWIHADGIAVADVPVGIYPELAEIVRRYSSRDVDFADAALVWLANESGLNRILTVDRADFSTFRLKNGKRFELIEWF